jgi:hypothetical protein
MPGIMARQCPGVCDDATSAVSAAPTLLEDYAARLMTGRLAGAAAGVPGTPGRLLVPRDRNKTLTALARQSRGIVFGSSAAAVLLSESPVGS